jgi:general secretion pathway protein K
MTFRSPHNSERGFALFGVLWVMVGVSALALVAALAAREAVQAARNRSNLIAARWQAEECLARGRAVVAEALAQARAEGPSGATWDQLDRRLAASPLVGSCELRMRPVGSGIDVNTVDDEVLGQLLRGIGVPEASTDSMVAALLDWRDPDDEPRPLGLEASGYRALHRAVPRDAPFADVREIALVRGFERLGGLDTLFAVEPGPIPLNHAPLVVLAALPGFSPEAIAQIAALRSRGERIGDLFAVQVNLSSGARQELMDRYAELALATTASPVAWVMTARAASGSPPVAAVLEARLVRAGDRAALVRRRSWIE